MTKELYAIIVENPEVPNIGGVLGGTKPVLADSVEQAEKVVDNHIFDIIDMQHPHGSKLRYEIVPWLENKPGEPVFIIEKDGYSYKRYDPRLIQGKK